MALVSITTRGVDQAVRATEALRSEVRQPGDQVLRAIGTLVVRDVQRGIRSQISPKGKPYPKVSRFGQPGRRLIDTNRLYNSITYEVRGGKVFVGTNLLYAPTQHFGELGRRAKNAKLLAIPMTRAIARAYRAGVSLREQYPDAFVFKSALQGLYLVRKRPGAGRGSKNQLEFLFKLVPSVDVPGTHFLGVSVAGEAQIRTMIQQRYGLIFQVYDAAAGGAE